MQEANGTKESTHVPAHATCIDRGVRRSPRCVIVTDFPFSAPCGWSPSKPGGCWPRTSATPPSPIRRSCRKTVRGMRTWDRYWAACGTPSPTALHSLLADGDDNTGVPDDEDGVSFGPVQVGQLGASVTVTVSNAPSGARLDAWIDFNGDGSWGGPLEQIADNVLVVNGSNVLTFDVPSTAADGTAIARFRLSTAGNLGVRGVATRWRSGRPHRHDQPPAAARGVFGNPTTISHNALRANFGLCGGRGRRRGPDVLSASGDDDKIAWYENNGSQGFTQRVISTTADGAWSVFAADVDGDGDTRRALGVRATTTRSRGTRTTDGDGTLARSRSSPRRPTERVRSSRRTWTATATWTSSPRRTATTRSPGTRTTAAQDFGPQRIISTVGQRRMVGLCGGRGRRRGRRRALGVRLNDDKIAWYENDGRRGHFGPQQVITTAADGAVSVVRGGRGRRRGRGRALGVRATTTRSPGTRTWTAARTFGPQQVITTAADGASVGLRGGRGRRRGRGRALGVA